MRIRITTLIDNFSGQDPSLYDEHGLSFLVEVGDPSELKLLFDTGQSGRFLANARLLGRDLSGVSKVLISHGHFDHGGGLRDFVAAFGRGFELLVGEDFFAPKYANNDGVWQFLGNSFDDEYLRHNSIQISYLTQDVTTIVPGVHVVTNIPRTNDFEDVNQRFYLFNGQDYELDFFNDEIVLVLEAKEGLIVLLGCSHPGMVNILEAVRSRFQKPLYAVIGGTHLMEADHARLNRTVEYLHGLELPLLGVSHCTGEVAMSRLKNEFPDFFQNSTGTVLEFD